MKKKVSVNENEYQSNVIQFSKVKRTKSGYAIWVGHNVIFINDGLLDYIKKSTTKKAS